jgi:hypothetical protein
MLDVNLFDFEKNDIKTNKTPSKVEDMVP